MNNPYRDDLAATTVDLEDAVRKAMDLMEVTLKAYKTRHNLTALSSGDAALCETTARLAMNLLQHNELWNMGETFERILRSLENFEDTLSTLTSDPSDDDTEPSNDSH